MQLPRESRRNQLLNVLEVDDPRLAITFHLMPRLTSLTPHLDGAGSPPPPPMIPLLHSPPSAASPLHSAGATTVHSPLAGAAPGSPVGVDAFGAPLSLQRSLAQSALDHARESHATEGFMLKNLEKDCE